MSHGAGGEASSSLAARRHRLVSVTATLKVSARYASGPAASATRRVKIKL